MPAHGLVLRRKVLVVYGTRPEAIKLAPVISALRESSILEPVVAVTGQHREMLDQVNELFSISPDHDLDIFRHGQSLTDITSRSLTGLTTLVQQVQPEAVVVQGDTTSTFAASRVTDGWRPCAPARGAQRLRRQVDLHIADGG
jgi:UDP-N-acetylglucosamine 2-epimerase (non-hydrolysing)